MASSQDLRPPVARKVPKETTIHGDRIVDSYFWIREKSNPGVIEYIQAENDYTIRMTEHTVGLQKTLFNEFRRRIVEEDSTVPVKVDDYFYYSRTRRANSSPSSAGRGSAWNPSRRSCSTSTSWLRGTNSSTWTCTR